LSISATAAQVQPNGSQATDAASIPLNKLMKRITEVYCKLIQKVNKNLSRY